MKKFISILFGKICIFILKIFRRGSVLPGAVSMKIDKDIMFKFKPPKIVIAVTGSSGKGSTTSMIADVLKASGYKIAHNTFGSNLDTGITTLLLQNSSLNGIIKTDALICEVDERYAKYIFKAIKPNYVVITNITRDQPPRHGHFDFVFEEINKALTKGMHLILNADDPYLQKFNLNNEMNVTYYGINKTKYSYKEDKFKSLNITHCPKCNGKLKYNYYNFETYGDFKCSNCDFKRNKLNYKITNLDFDNSIMTINDKYNLHFPYGMLYCAYNTLAAFSLLSLIGLDKDKITDYISQIDKNTHKYNYYKFNKKNVYVLNNKNENSTTFNQSLLFVDQHSESKTIVIGWKEISRRYEFDDISWLYDIDFELLNNKSVNKVICVGIHKYNIATRMKYAGIDEKKILTFDSLNDTYETLNKSKDNIFAILNFDYVDPFNNLLMDGGK